MNTKLIGTSLLLSLALTALPALADEHESKATTTGTSTPQINREVNLVCMQTAVEKRDNAIIASVDKYHDSVKTALQTRRDALKAAWGMTDRKQRREALRAAWNAYVKAQKTAGRTFRQEKHSTWKAFYDDRKTCGSRGASEEPGNEGRDENL